MTFFRPLVILGVLAVLSILTSVSVGSASPSLTSAMTVFMGEGDSLQTAVVLELRLPRALSAFAVGGLLAVAGALMQVLLRNPLADPYILGVSGGASVAVLTAMLAGITGVFLTAAAFVGALLSTLMVFGLAHGRGSWTPTRLLLTGVVVAAGWGALMTLILATAPFERLPGMLYWLMGDLAYAGDPSPALGLLLFACLLLIPVGRHLNVLARGHLQAAALGLSVKPMEWVIYGAASLLTASAVAMAGAIGFVGLVIPHALRLVIGNDQRLILPASALAGGTLLVIADTLARTVIAPQQLPVGVLTALIGVPAFLYLLSRNR